MVIRDLVSVDGRPACEVDTAEELTQVLIPGRPRSTTSTWWRC